MNDPDIAVLTEMRALAARLTRSRDPLLAGAVAQLVGQIDGLLDLCALETAEPPRDADGSALG